MAEQIKRGGKTLLMLLLFFLAASIVAVGKGETQEMKVRVTVGDKEVTATLDDSETARAFASMLPLTLVLNDYAGMEKVSDLPGKLPTSTASSGYDPSVGDITYYAPWGNLAIFYKDYGYASGLVKLGRFDEGIELLGSQRGEFEADFELID